MLSLVFINDKVFAGYVKMDGDTDYDSGSIVVEEALEVREMMIPTPEGQVQRMVNFATVSPFDHTPVSILLNGVFAVTKFEETSNTQKAYDRYCEQLRQSNSKIQVVPAGAMPKYGPQQEGNKLFSGQFSGKKQ